MASTSTPPKIAATKTCATAHPSLSRGCYQQRSLFWYHKHEAHSLNNKDMKPVATTTYATASTTISPLAITFVDRTTCVRFWAKVASPAAVCFKGRAIELDEEGSGWGDGGNVIIIDLTVLLPFVPDNSWPHHRAIGFLSVVTDSLYSYVLCHRGYYSTPELIDFINYKLLN